MKFLIVDDELVSRMKMYTILSSLGECTLAENGKQALDFFKNAYENKDSFDLITLDISMNDVTGFDVLSQIRNMESKILNKKKAKVIMVTSHSDTGTIIDSVTIGCDEYIVKPFNKQTVYDKLKKIGLIKHQ